MTDRQPTIAIIGGTGQEGFGLALRWAKAGYKVIIGSRALEKATRKADGINRELSDQVPQVDGMGNGAAAQACEIAVLTVPYSAHQAILESVREPLQGKILVDVTVPLVPPRVNRVQLPPGGSASQQAQALLGKAVKVVAAFQNISAEHLRKPDHRIECDVLVCGDDEDAREQVIQLAKAADMIGWHAGPLANAVAVESLTPVLLSLNKRYKIPNAGIRIVGIPGKGATF